MKIATALFIVIIASNTYAGTADNVEANAAAIQALQSDVSTLQSSSTQNTSAINNLETSTSSNQAATFQNGAAISTLQSGVSTNLATGAQNAAAISAITGTLSAIQGTVSQNAADIVNVNNELSGLDGTVSQLQDNVSALISSGGSGSRVQYLGSTAGVITGSAGLKNIVALCQSEFPESRMCTSKEYFETTALPNTEQQNELAWIQPTLVGTGYGGNTADIISGFHDENKRYLTCGGWSSGGASRGLAIRKSGGFSTVTCGTTQSVACCR